MHFNVLTFSGLDKSVHQMLVAMGKSRDLPFRKKNQEDENTQHQVGETDLLNLRQNICKSFWRLALTAWGSILVVRIWHYSDDQSLSSHCKSKKFSNGQNPIT